MATNHSVSELAQTRNSPGAHSVASAPKRKISVILITADDSIWPQIGKFIPSRFTLKQMDSVEQLLEQTDMGATAVLLWDVRQESDVIARLSCLQQHSPRFAVLGFDAGTQAPVWAQLIRQNQIVARVDLPIAEGGFVKLLNQAAEEVQARAALLGESKRAAQSADAASEGASKAPWIIGASIALCAVIGAAFFLLRGKPAQPGPPVAQEVAAPATDQVSTSDTSVSAQVESLLESAGQAMLERRYIAPADNNALFFYRRVLTFDVDNGEARQGLERLAELLLLRAQSAVDQRQFESALQALEIARSLKPNDPRTGALDQRLASMRSELGAAQIQAALSAQNYERAAALIDDAVRAKTVNAAQAAQLREALKSQRSEFETGKFVKLAQARLQQDRLIDPPNDNAAFYLDRARRAGATPAAIAAETRALQQRVLESARTAIDQRRFTDADRWIVEGRSESAGAAAIAALQNDLAAARAKEAHSKPDLPAAASPGSASASGDDALNARSAPSAGAAATAAQPALVLLQPLRPEYPREAALKGVEGWVELGFIVTADGKPAKVRVTNASPAGVFDKAAVAAMQHARYQPLSTTDRSVSRQAGVRVSFRLSR